MNRPFLRQQASLQTTLTPRLQQSVHLLQLTSSEFARELDQAIVDNPFLEGSAIESGEPPDGAGPPDEAPTTVVEPSFDPGAPPGSDRAQAHGSSTAGRPMGSDDLGASLAVEVDLRQHLACELGTRRLPDRLHALARLVIESLDDDGYLRQDLAEVVDGFALDPAIDDDELAEALALVQQLGPAGLAARSVSECIRLQLEAGHPSARCDAARSLAIAIARDHLHLVARRDWCAIARLLIVPVEQVEAAVRLIRAVDPRPGRAFGGRTADAIVPDVLVRRGAKGWIVETNPSLVPRASINERYAELFHRATLEDRQPMAEQLQEARWLLRNMAQRFVTIRRVAESIVAEQSAFLEFGDIALKPLALRAIADRLALHESTISRATQGKYMATPRGVFEFRHFFSRDLPTATGGRASTASIRAGLRELIDREEKGRPWSDVDLARLLGEQGLCVARRTVSKYRAQMRIPSAEMRGE